jgi:hypothetical protein
MRSRAAHTVREPMVALLEQATTYFAMLVAGLAAGGPHVLLWAPTYPGPWPLLAPTAAL